MRKIPDKLRQEMERDPFYKQCCITGRADEKIDWHHNMIYGGNQVNEKWCILPLLQSIHRDIVKHKERCDWIMLNRATDAELERYSKAINYKHIRKVLNKKYGNKIYNIIL